MLSGNKSNMKGVKKMKKVFVGLVIFLASFITIYTIFIWEPKSVADIVN